MRQSLYLYLACFLIIVIGVILYNISFKEALNIPASPPVSSSNNVSTSTSSTNNNIIPSPVPNPKTPAPVNPVKPLIPAPVPKSYSPSSVEIMAWMYPGDPTCNASAEYSDGRNIDVLKPQYFEVSDGGAMITDTLSASGCNGYSAANVADMKKYSKGQFATFSSNDATNMDSFLTNALSDNTDVDTLVSFVVQNNITGIELDFEDFGGWSDSSYSKFKQFVTVLGDDLHKDGKELMVDGPATSNQTEEDWYKWRYPDFISLPVDKIVVMTYDYEYDQGVGQPISPISWIEATIDWTVAEFPDKSRLSFGIPSYGYKGIAGTQKFSLLTYDQIKQEPGFSTATRDPQSGEMNWQDGSNVYFYNDGVSMSLKLQAIESRGITSVSVWHLGGNLWFSKN